MTQKRGLRVWVGAAWYSAMLVSYWSRQRSCLFLSGLLLNSAQLDLQRLHDPKLDQRFWAFARCSTEDFWLINVDAHAISNMQMLCHSSLSSTTAVWQ